MVVQDSSRNALDLVHRWLSLAPAAQPGLSDLLAQLAEAFDAAGAGLAPLPEAAPALRFGPNKPPPTAALPWEKDPTLLEMLREAGRAVVLPQSPGSVAVIAVGSADYLLWVEDDRRSAWTRGETAALALFAQVFCRPLTDEPRPWAEVRERHRRQQRLEESARLVRKLAHDFGNVLTSLLGFTELSLGQRMPAGSHLQEYLSEMHRGAKGAAEWMRLLKLVGLRNPVVARPGSLAEAVRMAEHGRRLFWKPGAELVIDLAAGLPAAGVNEEHLSEVVNCLLENACDALPDGKGVVTLTVDTCDLNAAACLEYYGRPRPGLHVRLRVVDTGLGLRPDVQQRLFDELFFTTKLRRRGLGLAVVYGIAAGNQGGLRLVNGATGGLTAEVVFPVREPAPTAARPLVIKASGGAEKVLVVDDDPLVRRFVQATLARAGYRVEAVATVEEALASYHADPRDPFQLVLSDLIMPQATGVDLARRLMQSDASARLLFMSGQAGLEKLEKDPVLEPFDLIEKPFKSDRLLQAVRSAIDK